MDRELAKWDFRSREPKVTLLAPESASHAPALHKIGFQRAGFLRGQLWEQIELPVYARKGILLSFANLAPLILRNQCVTIHDASVFAVPDAYTAAFRHWYRQAIPSLGKRAHRIVTDSQFSRAELISPARRRPHARGCAG
jgi:hypothetical protein